MIDLFRSSPSANGLPLSTTTKKESISPTKQNTKKKSKEQEGKGEKRRVGLKNRVVEYLKKEFSP